MSGIDIRAGLRPAATNEKKTDMPNPNGARKMNLLYEALSRARMRRPGEHRLQAPRSARRVAMEAHRREAARQLSMY
jgi:hypothetical protein